MYTLRVFCELHVRESNQIIRLVDIFKVYSKWCQKNALNFKLPGEINRLLIELWGPGIFGNGCLWPNKCLDSNALKI